MKNIILALAVLFLFLPCEGHAEEKGKSEIVQAKEAKNLFENFTRTPGAVTTYKLNSGRFFYSYEAKYFDDSRIDSTIQVKLLSTGALRYLNSSINLSPPEACNKDVGVIHEFVVGKSKLILMCAGDTGHRRQLFVFRDADMVGKIELGRSQPEHIDIVENNALRVLIHTELSLPNGGFDQLPQYLMMNFSGLLGFEMVTGKSYKEFYQSDYEKKVKLLDNDPQIDKTNFVRSSLAALISYADNATICNEIKKSKIFNGFSITELSTLSSEISKYGYPYFDVLICNKF